jgi:hypothetical protein
LGFRIGNVAVEGLFLSDDQDSTASERGFSVIVIAIAFIVFSALAVFSVVVADNVAVWIRASFVLAACFFGWLLFLAPWRVRVAVARWFPWFW